MKDLIATKNSSDNQLSIKEQLFAYLAHWRWFLLSIAIMLLISYVYLRYSIPIYSTEATIFVKDDQKGGGATEFNALENVGVYSGIEVNNIDNEIEVLRSRGLMSRVVNDLNLAIEYHGEGSVISTEIYEDANIRVRFIGKEAASGVSDFQSMTIKVIDTKSFHLTYGKEVQSVVKKYGQTIDLGFGEFMVVPESNRSAAAAAINPSNIIVKFFPHDMCVEKYRNAISIDERNMRSSVVSVSYTHLTLPTKRIV